jgi:hypothetical protein
MRCQLRQGTLAERGRISTVDLLVKTACVVKKKYIFSVLKGPDLN